MFYCLLLLYDGSELYLQFIKVQVVGKLFIETFGEVVIFKEETHNQTCLSR